MILDQVGEPLAAKLGERVTTVAAAPLAFTACGMGIWLLDVGPTDGWDRVVGWVSDLDGGQAIALATGVLLILAGAGTLVRQLVVPATRALEGYWPRWLARAARIGRARAWRRRQHAVTVATELAPKIAAGIATPEDAAQFLQADRTRRGYPSRENSVMPTRVGNRLRSSETRPWDKYGLDAVKVWPAMWLVLPDTARAELARSRGGLDAAIVGLLWCVAGFGFVAIAWWAAPLALFACGVTYRWWVLPSVAQFGDLLEAAFDVHRFALYAALRLPPPPTAAEERATGRVLTDYLWRGSDDPALAFDAPSADLAHGGPEHHGGTWPQRRGYDGGASWG